MNYREKSGNGGQLQAKSEVGTSSNSDISLTANSIATTSGSPRPSKNKNSWLSSLTRRKKPQSQIPIVDTPSSQEHRQMQNNNNEPMHLLETNSNINEESNLPNDVRCPNYGRKQKYEKNVFQRLGQKIGLRFSSFRNKGYQGRNGNNINSGGTLDASAEFLAQSPIREKQTTIRTLSSSNLDEADKPFTHNYDQFIVRKWLDQESGPNHVMYKASSEMLSQVWYWGEISRLDAQRQLSDKPTGSFLVRDSETRGCQFTLSFRIVNVTLHYRLEYRDNYWHFEELQYESIVEMIEDILYRCSNDNFVCFVKVQNELQPPCPVILKYPLSRYFKMPHLQDLCRRVIQRHAAPEEIVKLPIPPKLHEYLNIKRELVFQS